MTTLPIHLTSEETRWLEDWSLVSGYKTPEEAIKEVLKVCGGIPRGSAYWQEKFSFAED